MALATYGDLKTSVANWLGRADLTTLIPDFCTLAHKKLMTDLRGHSLLRQKKTTFSITGEYVATPANFRALTSIYLNTTPRRALEYISDDQGTNAYSTGTAGIPRYVSISATAPGTGTDLDTDIVGTEYLRFFPIPGSTYTATIEYEITLPFFSADTSTGSVNWILTRAPDCYLYGSLVQAAAYIKDDARVGLWQQAYSQAVQALLHDGRVARYGANGMTVRTA